jgi:hypothetical protein
MVADRSSLVQRASGNPESFEQAFRSGCAIVVPWAEEVVKVSNSMGVVGRYLSTLPVESSFQGADGLSADRQSLWVAITGLMRRLHTEPSATALLDGDHDGGVRGLEMLRSQPAVVTAFSALKDEIDSALRATIVALRLHEDLPPSCLSAVTIRYRAIRYAPIRRDVAGVGMHPDGNVISALITDQPGLVVLGGLGWVVRPAPEAGIIVMPGSILTRWSEGALLPTMHAVEIRRDDPVKCSVVGFLNFADGCYIPRSSRLTGGSELFHNMVREFKYDDMRSDGSLSAFYRDRGFVVDEGGHSRFRTLAELTAQE